MSDGRPRPYAHALIVGGTGMLFGTTVAIAARSERVTSVARTLGSLAKVDAAVRQNRCVHHMLRLDWHDPERFALAIEHHVAATVPPDLVIAWIHDDELAITLAERLATPERAPTFVHVVGSATGSPAAVADAARKAIRVETPIAYRQVILGGHRSERGARWLTHDEISTGVLEAVEQEQGRLVVGTLPPA